LIIVKGLDALSDVGIIKKCSLFRQGRGGTGCWIMLAKEMGFVLGQQFPFIIHDG